ncbi:Tc toxin subunit A [Pseudomonas sp. Marseille-P9899]|uniref:Tc toxin subunit A n=1 Tax=Pseudomonas sp. Marseille-P9899 TaxID=2730401 RepID=UPI00158F5F1B|nr:Tc toxin subunit A [Pseudomonas sp. Marseille-P9899]
MPRRSRVSASAAQPRDLLQAGLDSAFSIARGTLAQLMARRPDLAGDEARALHQRASTLAVLAARHYREQRLTGTASASAPWRTGLRALVDGPTFENQFQPSWGDNCLPGAIEATTSPVAYLVALYQWVTTVIEPMANDQAITLAQRRPDLASLMLDNQAFERVEPTIGIVNGILERAARKHLDDHNQKDRTVDDALAETRYPFALPFERYLLQIRAVLQREDYGLGDLIRQLDPDFPYFCQGGLHSQRSDDALQMDMAMGPELRALLLESPYFPRGARRASTRSVQTRSNPRTLLRESVHAAQSGFYPRHYGVDTARDLLDLSAFSLRTTLDQDAVASLLSIEQHAPTASPHVPGLAPASPARFGSTYINAGEEPVIALASKDGTHTLSNWTDDHFDRMQRVIRLSRGLGLSLGETDRLLDAALQAEHGEAGRGAGISENTLRALGLFCRLRRDFKVSAEDFAALLNGLALYALGSEAAQFDRVFNDPTLFSEPLLLDDSAFDIAPSTEAEYRKVHHLCSALGMSFETYLYVARYIAQTLGEQQVMDGTVHQQLHWSQAVVSAFYRLTRLPALLGLSSIEAIALLQLIGQRGHQYVSRLIRPALAVHQHTHLSDSLSVIQSLTDTVQWCRDNDLTVAWLYQHLMPLAPVAAASDRELDLLKQINGRMLPAILSETTFIDAGVPMEAGVDHPVPIDWLQQLDHFVSAQGLIRELPGYRNTDAYEEALKARLQIIIDNLELSPAPELLVRLFQLVMGARAAQQSLVWESLANTLGGSAELSRELLVWTGGNSYQLLQEVLRLFDGSDPTPLPVPVGDEVLALLARLTHRMGIVEHLSLSPLALRSYIAHPEWFDAAGEPGPDAADISFSRLHVLVQYRALLEQTRQGEEALLDYLKLVNSLPPDLSEQDLLMIREDAAGKIALFTGFGIRDVLETMAEITATGFVTTVRQLDHLVRVRQACQTLQLGSSAAIALSRLRSNSSREHYRNAAEGALSSLTGNLQEQAGVDQGELGQSEASWIVVDTQQLVAGSGEKALCLLTVKNFLGQPMADITVTWESSLGQLHAPSSTSTDENGQVSIELLAAGEMGVAQVIARFGLDRRILAPLIHIDCDESSLRFKDPVCEPTEALAGNLQTISFHLQLLDKYDNPGRDRVLAWSTDLGTFERPQTRTDAQGFSRAGLRSLSSGLALVIVDFASNGERERFEPVTFLEQPYFQYVRFSGPAATTQEVTVTCRVVNLDGSPVAGASVDWTADLGGFVEDPARSLTDAQGIASITFLSAVTGQVRVTVNAEVKDVPLQTLTSEAVTVHELPRLFYMHPEEQDFVIYQSRPAHFEVGLRPEAAGYPVTWWADGKLLATTATDRYGKAEYQRHFTQAELGEHIIQVRSIRENDVFDYKVRVVSAHNELTAHIADDSAVLLPVAGAAGTFVVDRGYAGGLLIRALRSDGSGDADCRLTFSLGSGADPERLGLQLDPPLGSPVDCDAKGEVLLSIDATRAAFEANSDPYNNEVVLNVISNLGITLVLRVRLREVVDLTLGTLRLALDGNELATYAGLSGYLRRLNGDAAPSVRETANTLRLTVRGATHSADSALHTDSAGQVWIYYPAVSGKAGELKPHCTFEPVDGLEKRLHLVANSIEPEPISKAARITVTATPSDALIELDGDYLLDHGSIHRFVLNVSDGAGGISGVRLLGPSLNLRGALYTSDGLSDQAGDMLLTVDTRNADCTVSSMPLVLGPVGETMAVRVCEFVVMETNLQLDLEASKVKASVEFFRRDEQLFGSTNAWHGFFRIEGGALNPVTFKGDAQRVRGSSVWLSTPVPGTLVFGLSFPTSQRVYLLSPSEFPITDDLSSGDAS